MYPAALLLLSIVASHSCTVTILFSNTSVTKINGDLKKFSDRNNSFADLISNIYI
jgi:hypothetical protein